MSPRPARKTRPCVVIVGANFAGLTAAMHLDPDRYDVTVLDRTPWFEWLPNVHELLSGVKKPADLRLQRRRLLARAGHRFIQAEVTRVDAGRRRVLLADGRTRDFDACIVAVGGVDETFGVPGVARHAMSFKSVAECAAIGRRLASLARSREKKSVVIVGGGLEGVEALGEILRRYGGHGALEVTVIEAGSRLLPGTPAKLDKSVRSHCARLGVRVLTGKRVTSVTPARVRLDSGESLRSDLTIWTGGAAPSPLLRSSGLARKAREWARVRPTLQSLRFDDVFVIGDAAALPRPIRKQAFFAIQMGECAAANVKRKLAGKALRAFRPESKPLLVAFGDLDTFLVAGGRALASPAFAAAKEGVFQLTMAQFDPPVRTSSALRLGGRLSGAAARIAWPAIAKWS
jgi:NADH dehydrogenase FAD-containing subunit